MANWTDDLELRNEEALRDRDRRVRDEDVGAADLTPDPPAVQCQRNGHTFLGEDRCIHCSTPRP